MKFAKMVARFIGTEHQCGSCEQVFYRLTEDRKCPHCGSGNWVFGYIAEPEPKSNGGINYEI